MSYQTDIAAVGAMLDMCWAFASNGGYPKEISDGFENIAMKLDRVLYAIRGGD